MYLNVITITYFQVFTPLFRTIIDNSQVLEHLYIWHYRHDEYLISQHTAYHIWKGFLCIGRFLKSALRSILNHPVINTLLVLLSSCLVVSARPFTCTCAYICT